MISPGRVLYWLWYWPIQKMAESRAAGGPIEQRRNRRGQRAMADSIRDLHPVDLPGEPLIVYFLSGSRFWYQTAYCAWSLAITSGRPVEPLIFDDGSLRHWQAESLKWLLPGTRVVSREEAWAIVEKRLPVEKFPCLRERWLNYPNIRKLIDPHLMDVDNDYKLVLDSDMLFFRRPEELLNAVQNEVAVVATDVIQSYGYAVDDMSSLAGDDIPDLVNVGVTGLSSSAVDWVALESWTAELQAKAGTSYFLEQALAAMLLVGKPHIQLDRDDYKVLPAPEECSHPSAVLHHYVANSKRGYFREAWRHAASIPTRKPIS